MKEVLKMPDYRIIDNFLLKYGQHPSQVSLKDLSKRILKQMKTGLKRKNTDLLMLPTYLTYHNEIPLNVPVTVIDAGGTNLRVANVTFTPEGSAVTGFKKRKMFGTDEPIDKDEFIEELTKLILPLVKKTTEVGFCFSYPCEIRPNRDGKVISLSKGVRINGIEGTVLGKELKRCLRKHGIRKKMDFVILNDTVSTLLATSSFNDGQNYSGQLGLILGTGTNTAYLEKTKNITKVRKYGYDTMIINMESGNSFAPQGEVDKELDAESANPGHNCFEKMISGSYIGPLMDRLVRKGQAEGIFHQGELPEVNTIHLSVFLKNPHEAGNPLSDFARNDEERELLYYLADQILTRASKLVVANLAAIALLTDAGKEMSRPIRVLIEGTTYYKTYSYKEKIDYFMKDYINNNLHRWFYFCQSDDANLIGSAIAALANNIEKGTE